MAGDLRPILGTDVPTAAKVFGRDVVSRTMFGIDRGKNVDRGGDLRSGCQGAGSPSPFRCAGPSLCPRARPGDATACSLPPLAGRGLG